MAGILAAVGGTKTLIIGAACAIALAAAGAGGFKLAWQLQAGAIAKIQLADARAEAAAVTKARVQEAAAAKVSDEAGAKAADHQAKIQVVTRTIVREVPAHVTPQADARCVIPVGLVRVHDAAARGVDVTEVPDPTGRSDDAPASVRCSELAGVVADNYGLYRSVSQQLIDLQDWVTAQAALAAAEK
jgi:hypothetical protein